MNICRKCEKSIQQKMFCSPYELCNLCIKIQGKPTIDDEIFFIEKSLKDNPPILNSNEWILVYEKEQLKRMVPKRIIELEKLQERKKKEGGKIYTKSHISFEQWMVVMNEPEYSTKKVDAQWDRTYAWLIATLCNRRYHEAAFGGIDGRLHDKEFIRHSVTDICSTNGAAYFCNSILQGTAFFESECTNFRGLNITACAIREVLRDAMMTAETLFKPPSDTIDNGAVEEMLNHFMLYKYVSTGFFYVAGGFLLRMLENPNIDVSDIAAEHDIDIFYRDVRHVYDWIVSMRANGAFVYRIADRHDLFSVTLKNMPCAFLIQFSETDAGSIYELLESFDLPMCQIGVDASMRCCTSFGFDWVWENRDDVVIYLCNYCSTKVGEWTRKSENSSIVLWYMTRIAKYAARGYHFRVVQFPAYYGLTDYCYTNDITETDINEYGTVDIDLFS